MFKNLLRGTMCALFLSCAAAAADQDFPVTVVISHPVSDYEAWRAVYDEVLPMREEAGMISATVLRAADDPGMIILIHEFESFERAKQLFSSAELKSAMQEGGVTAKPVITIARKVD